VYAFFSSRQGSSTTRLDFSHARSVGNNIIKNGIFFPPSQSLAVLKGKCLPFNSHNELPFGIHPASHVFYVLVFSI
jgi:hypothetical protein